MPKLLILQVLWLCELVKLTLFTPSSAIRKVAHLVPKAFTSKERMTLETLARRPRFVQCKFCSTAAAKLSACPIKECPDSCLTCTSSTKCDVVMIIRFPFHDCMGFLLVTIIYLCLFTAFISVSSEAHPARLLD